MDGDGIETVAAKGFVGALFDHRNQGIRTATGWVSADDGLLVRDLNGNGIIDNGAELFGDNPNWQTVLCQTRLRGFGRIGFKRRQHHQRGRRRIPNPACMAGSQSGRHFPS
ncbi:putative iron-regulated protein FrpC [Neisseria meningitidis 2002038]|nr:putative iron-regulated protein FrpC [Neisseria meningitidis 2002038]